MAYRPWTRLGVLGMAGHLAYELLAGVGVPLAPRMGVRTATTGYVALAAAAYRSAGRLHGPRSDRLFAAVNGFFLAAVLAHFTSWPRTARAGLPWLVECEGLEGGAIAPYNVLLHVSALAALGGVVENRRGWLWGATAFAATLPRLRREQHSEYARLLAQAAREPRWWNRRLAARSAGHAAIRATVATGRGVRAQ